MKRLLLIVLIFSTGLFAYDCDEEKLFWDEIKNSKDIADFKYYNQRYPDGIYEYLANKAIKQLRGGKKRVSRSGVPNWINGDTPEYRYYAVAYANVHFKGKHYQENLARGRAIQKLQDEFNEANLDADTHYRYNSIVQTKVYKDKKGKIYVMAYIDNYDL
jgi:hypothetical protein